MIVAANADSFESILTVTGRFDANTTGVFRRYVDDLVSRNHRCVTLDLRGVPFIDIHAVREVAALSRRLDACGRPFRIFPSDVVQVTFGFLDGGCELDMAA